MSDASNPSGDQSLQMGSIIGGAFGLTFKNYISLLLVSIIPLVIVGAVFYYMLWPVFASMITGAVEGGSASLGIGGAIVGVIVTAVLFGLAVSFIYAGAISVFFDSRSGRGASVGKAFSAGMKRMLQLFVVSIILGILLGIVNFGLQWLITTVAIDSGSIALVYIGMIIVLVVMLYLYAVFLPVYPSCVVENLWISAIGRGIELSAGYRWMLVLLFVVFGIILGLIMALIGLVFYLLASSGLNNLYILGALMILVMVFIIGSATGLMTLAYARLREIKEGTTIESLADVFE